MKYFMDCEFLEGTQKEKFPISLFRKTTPPTIDLISIGLVSEDNREYYAISKDFNLDEAWNRFDLKEELVIHNQAGSQFSETVHTKVYWIRENVLKPIFKEFYIDVFGCDMPIFCYDSMKYLINKIGKTNKEIANEIKEFCKPSRTYEVEKPITVKYSEIQNPEFYAYFGSYDWVVFCWIFGKMIELPNGFPMYVRDLKQVLDEIQEEKFGLSLYKGKLANNIKELPLYPKQENEHSAIHDARWNKKLHEFLNKL